MEKSKKTEGVAEIRTNAESLAVLCTRVYFNEVNEINPIIINLEK